MIHDTAAEAAIRQSVNMTVPWYLMAAYGYYHRGFSLLSDPAFDQICLTLQRRWDEIEHRHKHIIDRRDIAAGSCFLPVEAFPPIVKSAALILASFHLAERLEIIARDSPGAAVESERQERKPASAPEQLSFF